MTQEMHPYFTTPINQLIGGWCGKFDKQNKVASVAQAIFSILAAGFGYGAWRAFSSKTLSLKVKVLTVTFCAITILALGLFFVASHIVKKGQISFTTYLRKLGAEAQKKQESGATTIESYRYAFQEMKKADYDRMTTQELEVFRRLEICFRGAELPGQEETSFRTPFKWYHKKNITKYADRSFCLKMGGVRIGIYNKEGNWEIRYPK